MLKREDTFKFSRIVSLYRFLQLHGVSSYFSHRIIFVISLGLPSSRSKVLLLRSKFSFLTNSNKIEISEILKKGKLYLQNFQKEIEKKITNVCSLV